MSTVNISFKTPKGHSNVSVDSLLFELLSLAYGKQEARVVLRELATAESKAGTASLSKRVQQAALLHLMALGVEMSKAQAFEQLDGVGQALVNLADAMTMLKLPAELSPEGHTQH